MSVLVLVDVSMQATNTRWVNCLTAVNGSIRLLILLCVYWQYTSIQCAKVDVHVSVSAKLFLRLMGLKIYPHFHSLWFLELDLELIYIANNYQIRNWVWMLVLSVHWQQRLFCFNFTLCHHNTTFFFFFTGDRKHPGNIPTKCEQYEFPTMFRSAADHSTLIWLSLGVSCAFRSCKTSSWESFS